MRELISVDDKVIIVPHDFEKANKGIVTEVAPDAFVLKLNHSADGILKNNYCEFYVQTKNGTLYFDTYPKEVADKTITVASPAKHKFLQRRQYTRIKYNLNLDLTSQDKVLKIDTLDISAGGMKLITRDDISINGYYNITLPLSEEQNISCKFSPCSVILIIFTGLLFFTVNSLVIKPFASKESNSLPVLALSFNISFAKSL